MTLHGPFTQIITLDHLPMKGPISDASLEIIEQGGILVEGEKIVEVGRFSDLTHHGAYHVEVPTPSVAIPGFIDAHTHLCFAGSRHADYALRVNGTPYQEIAAKGGGILDTVQHTRRATKKALIAGMIERLNRQMNIGVTTCEIKSGYGLSVEQECRILRAILSANKQHPINLIPTCLAAHTTPKEFPSPKNYLQTLMKELFPKLKKLTHRIDIFVEEGAFPASVAKPFLLKAKKMGFDVSLHANQFTPTGASLAAEVQALSADHLETLSREECYKLRDANVVATILPGASLGLGMPMAPARLMLDTGLCVAIASDWNPGSAPMGHLLAQAAILGAAEKLSTAETFSALTFRAAQALNLSDRGIIQAGLRADFAIFPCHHYQEILYHQGTLLPFRVVIGGQSYEF